jgi:hypothetical protein
MVPDGLDKRIKTTPQTLCHQKNRAARANKYTLNKTLDACRSFPLKLKQAYRIERHSVNDVCPFVFS